MKRLCLAFAVLIGCSRLEATTKIFDLAANAENITSATARGATLVLWNDVDIHWIEYAIVGDSGQTLFGPSRIVESTSLVQTPRAASDGGTFLVAVQFRSGVTEGLIIAPSGAVTRRPFTILAGTPDDGAHYSRITDLEWSGTRYLLTVSDSGTSTVGVWMSRSGGVEDSFRLPLAVLTVAHDSSVGIAWSEKLPDRSAVHFAEFAGGALSPPTTIAAEFSFGPDDSPFADALSIGWNGNDYYVVWAQGKVNRAVFVNGARVTSDGSVSSFETFDVRNSMALPDSAQVNRLGDRYVVTYRWAGEIEAVWPTGSSASPHSILFDDASSSSVFLLATGELGFAYVQNAHAGVGLYVSSFRRAAHH